MARILVLHAGWHGQAERIAQRLSQAFAVQRHTVAVACAHAPDVEPEFSTWDAVVIGGSIHRGKHHPLLAPLVREHLVALRSRPNAFFSVSLSAAGSPRQQGIARDMLARFLEATGWEPDTTATFAGALPYSRYRWPLRMMIRFIAMLSGRDTDTSRDYEYTDWRAVDRFAAEFAQRLKAPEPAP